MIGNSLSSQSFHKASHLTLSNAFDKSKFIIANGMLASAVSSNNKLATNKRSSIQSDLPLKPVSENASMRSNKIYAIGRKSDGWLARFFCEHHKKSCYIARTKTCAPNNTSLNSLNKCIRKSGGECFNNSAVRPVSSVPFPNFNLLIAAFSSGMVEVSSFKTTGGTIDDGEPAKIHPNMFARFIAFKSFASGCCGTFMTGYFLQMCRRRFPHTWFAAVPLQLRSFPRTMFFAVKFHEISELRN